MGEWCCHVSYKWNNAYGITMKPKKFISHVPINKYFAILQKMGLQKVPKCLDAALVALVYEVENGEDKFDTEEVMQHLCQAAGRDIFARSKGILGHAECKCDSEHDE